MADAQLDVEPTLLSLRLPRPLLGRYTGLDVPHVLVALATLPVKVDVNSVRARYSKADATLTVTMRAQRSADTIGLGNNKHGEKGFANLRGKRDRVVQHALVGPRAVLLDQRDIKIQDTSLGSGRFGTVVLGEWLGQQVAIKRVVPSMEADAHTRTLLEEELLKLLPHNHPNILPIYGLVELPEGGLWLVLKHGKQGSLTDVLRSSAWRGRDRGCPRKFAVHVAKGVCSALAYLHSQSPPIVYRDLKPGNIILSGGSTPLLDPEFGAVRTILSEIVSLRTRTNASLGSGTRVSDAAYHAPECLSASKPDDWHPPADIYSLGQLLYDMLTGTPPFANLTEPEVARALLAQHRPPLPSRLHPRLSSTIQSCWAQDPASRPTARVLLQVFSDLETEFAEDECTAEYVGSRGGSRASPSLTPSAPPHPPSSQASAESHPVSSPPASTPNSSASSRRPQVTGATYQPGGGAASEPRSEAV